MLDCPLLVMSFETQRVLNFMKPNQSNFSFLACDFDAIVKKPLNIETYSCIFFMSFKVLALTFMSVSFWVYFCIWMSTIILLHVDIQLFQHHCFKYYSFPQISGKPSLKSVNHNFQGFFDTFSYILFIYMSTLMQYHTVLTPAAL